MKNRLPSAFLAAIISIAPIESDANDTQEHVHGILCEMPKFCVEGTESITGIRIIPEDISAKNGEKSTIEINAQCDTIDGDNVFLSHGGIDNLEPAIINGRVQWFRRKFQEQHGIIGKTIHNNKQSKMQCSVEENIKKYK